MQYAVFENPTLFRIILNNNIEAFYTQQFII